MKRGLVVLALFAMTGCGAREVATPVDNAASPTTSQTPTSTPSVTPTRTVTASPTATAHSNRHVFVIVLENEDADAVFGSGTKIPYLARTLTSKGRFLPNYYGVAHHSLPNYIAMVSGQPPNRTTQADCPRYLPFQASGEVGNRVLIGTGCVYPRSTPTLMKNLKAAKLAWRGYMDGMGQSCRHSPLGSADQAMHATRTDQYATRHNPFVYFRSVIDSASCQKNDVDLSYLTHDLRRVKTTRNFTFISPNLCNDGHDAPCANGDPGGMVSANRFLKRWVPKILDSPAYRKNGLLIVTFDEGEDSSEACCISDPGPNVRMPGLDGPGGGRTGAVLLSPRIKAGTTDRTAHNHYSLLATIEDLFGLPRIGLSKDATPIRTTG